MYFFLILIFQLAHAHQTSILVQVVVAFPSHGRVTWMTTAETAPMNRTPVVSRLHLHSAPPPCDGFAFTSPLLTPTQPTPLASR